jgi:acetoin:2,6-dichlorophenolindophenol oxidoreductase subunit beta
MPWTTPSIDIIQSPNETTDSVRKLSYRDAIREAQLQLLTADSKIFLMGEGVDDAGGIFGSTLGLADEFGAKRVVDTPIAENGMTGIAIGAAINGMKPIFIHMRPDFVVISLDQLLNHAAKWFYMSGGQVSVPLTIRCVIGRGWGSAAQHSQSIQGLLTHLPGLKVVMPATAHDAKGLLVAAVHDPNPVVILEHRWLYDKIGYVPEELYETPIARASVCRKGKDLTLVATSLMVHEAMKAAQTLAGKGYDVEVIDLRSVKPWDEKCIIDSVKKTGKLVVADTGHGYGGVAAEIISCISERCFEYLKAPLKRVTLPEAPVPAAPSLEKIYFPNHREILKAVKDVVGY